MSNQTISIGRIVHFTLGNGDVRPAIVVAVWPTSVNLQVFVDGSNDGESRYHNGNPPSGIFPEEGKAGVAWRTSVHPSKSGSPEPGCWHWPPYVPAAAVPA